MTVNLMSKKVDVRTAENFVSTHAAARENLSKCIWDADILKLVCPVYFCLIISIISNYIDYNHMYVCMNWANQRGS